jgi:hypothetical protein
MEKNGSASAGEVGGKRGMAQASSADFATTLGAWVVGKIRRLDRNLLESYRPELHYMRGPGPKWREKHGQTPARPDIRDLAVPDLRNAGA